MNTYYVDDIGDAWGKLVQDVTMKGVKLSPRGKLCKELENVLLEYTKPKTYSFKNRRRVINPVFHLVELFYFLNGRTDSLLSSYIKGMKEFENDFHRYDGSYGPSIYESLPFVIKELQDDRDSRRAVIPVLRSHHLNHHSKDIPCNTFFAFRIRDNGLNMNVLTRSQDLFRGFIYDTLEFQLLQLMLSRVLKVDVGSYSHNILSLHLYSDDHSAAISSLAYQFEDDTRVPSIPDFMNQEHFWRYCREISAASEFARVEESYFDDIQLAMVNWRNRTVPTISGYYCNWVDWWLNQRNTHGAS